MTRQSLREALDDLATTPGVLVVGEPPNPVRLPNHDLHALLVAADRGFRRQGVAPGDRVLIRIGTCLDDVVALLGLIRLGAVPVSVKPRVPGAVEGAYLTEVTRQQGASHAYGIAHPALHAVDLLPPEQTRMEPAYGEPPCGHDPGGPSDPGSVAFIQYTSGSTGSPRAVPLTNRALMANLAGIAGVAGMGPDSRGLIVLPLHHDMGLIGMLSCLVHGGGAVLFDTAGFLRRPLACLELAAEIGTTDAPMPDFLLRYLAKRLRGPAAQVRGRQLFASWRTVVCGAEPIRRSTVRDFLAVAQPLGLAPSTLTFCYGLAEATLLVTAHRYAGDEASFAGTGPEAPARLGRPVPGVELRIAGPEGGPVGDREPGRVLLRGETLFNGYDGATDHRTAWFDTGDIGLRRDGDLYLCGRSTDRLKVNGSSLFMTDVESHVLSDPSVSDCVAVPHGDGFAVLVVPGRSAPVDALGVAAAVTAAVGVAPLAVREIRRSAIVRTASGKPVRSLIAAELEKRERAMEPEKAELERGGLR